MAYNPASPSDNLPIVDIPEAIREKGKELKGTGEGYPPIVNAITVDGHGVSTTPEPGAIPVMDEDGKLPAELVKVIDGVAVGSGLIKDGQGIRMGPPKTLSMQTNNAFTADGGHTHKLDLDLGDPADQNGFWYHTSTSAALTSHSLHVWRLVKTISVAIPKPGVYVVDMGLTGYAPPPFEANGGVKVAITGGTWVKTGGTTFEWEPEDRYTGNVDENNKLETIPGFYGRNEIDVGATHFAASGSCVFKIYLKGATGTEARDIRIAIVGTANAPDASQQYATTTFVEEALAAFGLESVNNAQPSELNLNNQIKPGFFSGPGSGGVNWPGSTSSGFLVCFRKQNVITQFAIYEPSDQLYVRSSVDAGTTWGTWKNLILSSDVSSTAAASKIVRAASTGKIDAGWLPSLSEMGGVAATDVSVTAAADKIVKAGSGGKIDAGWIPAPGDIGAAAASHNHDAAYSGINHNHDAAYSGINHNHDSVYAALNHEHTTRYGSAVPDNTVGADGDWYIRFYPDSGSVKHARYKKVSGTYVLQEEVGATIVESGSNSNGGYMRWDDGTQICNGSITIPANATARVAGTYPASFVGVVRTVGQGPAFSHSINIPPTNIMQGAVADDNNVPYATVWRENTSGDKASPSVNSPVQYIAIGMWK